MATSSPPLPLLLRLYLQLFFPFSSSPRTPAASSLALSQRALSVPSALGRNLLACQSGQHRASVRSPKDNAETLMEVRELDRETSPAARGQCDRQRLQCLLSFTSPATEIFENHGKQLQSRSLALLLCVAVVVLSLFVTRSSRELSLGRSLDRSQCQR
jgi:hypothetical protein